ncbi:endonuclease domain-containing protein [Thermosulfurimonas dismutans]|uniref:Putative DNA methylase n=1 Tax=Thermosulfurimonas dismutans TaxID=999894 RepID=A0A179D2F8_9BACT|nr:endonuclease domain-containing protein [Thermosulfurimonas dismutans]OAQ20236.1 putative DNA methylase [Thermosulfurimonas dismutans]
MKPKRKYLYNSRLKEKARRLRRELTPAERKLWAFLRKRQFLGIKFHRQLPIGRYIVDFVAFNPKVVIDIDGDSHYTPLARKNDEKRDRYLVSLGFRVFRFTNSEVLGMWRECLNI